MTKERAYVFATAGNAARWQRHRTNPVQRTPDGLFRQLDGEFGFTVDAAASALNAKCPRFWTVADDALGRDWSGERVWCNPPFGAGLIHWTRKAWESSRSGALVVMLVPSATDAAWWHDYVSAADEIRFIRGRVAFNSEDGQKQSNAFFPVSILVFRPQHTGERDALQLDSVPG